MNRTNKTEIFDHREFRKTLGQFATGVTIVTTLGPDQSPIGTTCNSFNSLSMDPPMILWSLAKTAFSLPAFTKATFFNVHVLSAHQGHLSKKFSLSGADKFSGINYGKGNGGTPLLSGCTALFECKTAHQYDGGDHVIIVGTVLSYESSDINPLVFYGGQYTSIDSSIKKDTT